MHSNEFMSRANFTEYSSQDELEFISSFCTEQELSQASQLGSNMPLSDPNDPHYNGVPTMSKESVPKTGRRTFLVTWIGVLTMQL